MTSRIFIYCRKSLNYWWYWPRLKLSRSFSPCTDVSLCRDEYGMLVASVTVCKASGVSPAPHQYCSNSSSLVSQLENCGTWWPVGFEKYFGKLLFEISCVFTSTMTLSHIQRSYRCSEPMDLASVISVVLFL